MKNLVNPSVRFELSKGFVNSYANRKPPFGFNGLGELVYLRTYSRVKPDGSKEKWFETIERVVNGTYSLQKRWIMSHHLGWSEEKARVSAEEMYDRMFNMKFLPPGRGLWAMGSPLTEERGLYSTLNNCAFVSTKDLASNPTEPFTFMIDALMLGVGVGFDTRGAGTAMVYAPTDDVFIHEIEDSREGWVDSIRILLESYFYENRRAVSFDYSKIRVAGSPILGFGGTAAGPDGLKKSHDDIRNSFKSFLGPFRTSCLIDDSMIVDLMNLIGKGVVSGNVRRAAQIALGSPDSDTYLNLKNYEINPHRAEFGWTSNNSINAKLGQDYSDVAERIRINGEPGLVWLDNMRDFGRMGDAPDYKDSRVLGTNPCNEQSLENFELCALVEIFPNAHEDQNDFLRTLKFAYLYGKTSTLGSTHWEKTNAVMLRNRRLGCSLTGIAQFLAKRGVGELKQWCDAGFKVLNQWDDIYSDWLAIPKSIKTTSIKPSGSISLVAGATPGVHFPESRFYIRRVRLSKYSELIIPLTKAGYRIEEAFGDPNTLVVEIPVDSGEGVKSISQVSMWEQLAIAAFMQRYWANNQVSCTVTFDPETEGPQIGSALDIYQYQLKGISFLPRIKDGAYPQMPYQEISELQYQHLISKITPISFDSVTEEEIIERYCDSETCAIG